MSRQELRDAGIEEDEEADDGQLPESEYELAGDETEQTYQANDYAKSPTKSVADHPMKASIAKRQANAALKRQQQEQMA